MFIIKKDFINFFIIFFMSINLPVENQRVKTVIEKYCNGNELQFSKIIGISQPRINRLFSLDPRSDKYPLVSFEIIQAIINKFIDINAEWLISGRGSIDKDQLNLVNEPPSVYRLNSDKIVESQAIPLYQIEASAGIVTLFKDSQKFEAIDFIKIPNLPKCDGAVYVTGDSMYPLLKSGDIVMYKQINDIKNGIFWGEMYLVSIDQDGDELVMVKYIQKSNLGEKFIRLVSQNSNHQDRDIELKRVRALALIKGSIRINSMS